MSTFKEIDINEYKKLLVIRFQVKFQILILIIIIILYNIVIRKNMFF